MVRNVILLYHRVYAGLPREVWMLSGALFINRFGTMVLPFFALYVTSELGYRESTAGWLLTIHGVGAVLGAYLGGRLTPAIGAIRLQIVALLLSVPIFLIIPCWKSVWAIAVSMFFLAVCSDAVRPANATAVAHFAPAALRVRAFGLQRMALNLGITFGPAIGGLLATVSFGWLFVVDAATTSLCALSLAWFFGVGRIGQLDSERTSHAADKTAHRSPLKDPMFVTLLAFLLPSACVFMQVHATYPLYLRDHYGLSEPTIGLVYAVNTVVIVVFEMLLLDAIRRWSMIRVIGWGATLSCVGFGILPFGHSIAFCVFSMLVITVGEMLWMPLAMSWIAQRGERGDRAMYMSYCTMTYAIAAIVAPASSTAIYQYNRDLIWYISLGIGGVVLAGFYWLHHLLRRETAQQSVDADATACSPQPLPSEMS